MTLHIAEGALFGLVVLCTIFAWPRKKPEPPKTVREELLSRRWLRPMVRLDFKDGMTIIAAYCPCGNMHKEDDEREMLLCVSPDGFLLCHRTCVEDS